MSTPASTSRTTGSRHNRSAHTARPSRPNSVSTATNCGPATSISKVASSLVHRLYLAHNVGEKRYLTMIYDITCGRHRRGRLWCRRALGCCGSSGCRGGSAGSPPPSWPCWLPGICCAGLPDSSAPAAQISPPPGPAHRVRSGPHGRAPPPETGAASPCCTRIRGSRPRAAG